MVKRLHGRAASIAALLLCSAIPLSAAPASPPPVRDSFPALRRENIALETIAFRSNLLFLAAGAPNFAVELPFGPARRYSVAAAGAFTRFRPGNTYALQTLQGSLDAKYWFAPRRGSLTGWSAGLYATFGGPWDIRWRSGWQGNGFFSTGVSGGWAMPVARSLNLEFAAAAGWFHTREARRYTPDGDFLMWHQTRRNVDRFSLTRLQVNLVWLIDLKKY